MDKVYKYSEYLEARQKLNELDFSSGEIFKNEIEKMFSIVESVELVSSKAVRKKLEDVDRILISLSRLIKNYNEQVKIDMKPARIDLLKQSNLEFDYIPTKNELIDKRSRFKTPRYILEDLSGIIGRKVRWEFPVMYYEPNTADITRLIVAGEPFYIVDDYTESTKHVLNHLPPEMKNKVHHYNKADMATLIPDNSVGFVAVWKNFVFKKISVVQKDLELISQKLMPGGHLLFDFNDGETFAGARCSENQMYAFHWRERIEKFLDQCNLELVEYAKLNCSTGLTVALVKKKGTLVEINLVNKLGLICVDQTEKQKNTELKNYYLNIIQRINELNSQDQTHKKIKQDLERAFINHDNKQLIRNKRDKVLQQIKGIKHTQGTRSVAHVQLLLSVSRLSCPLEEFDIAMRYAQQAQRYSANLNNEPLKKEVDEWIKLLKN